MALKQGGVRFLLCPKQGNKIEGVVLNRVCILGFFLSKTGSGFQVPSGSCTYTQVLIENLHGTEKCSRWPTVRLSFMSVLSPPPHMRARA